MQNGIDFKLLEVIHNVTVTRSITATARLLGTSAGTISYRIAKARKVTGSHLFSRTRTGMIPDTTAIELSQRYQDYLSDAAHQVTADNIIPERKVCIHTNSLLEMMIAKHLPFPVTNTQHRHYAFKIYNPDAFERINHLRTGEIDIDIGPKLPASNYYSAVKLFSSEAAILCGKNNTRYGNSMTLKEWQDAKFISWSGTSDYWCGDVNTSVSVFRHLKSRNTGVISGSLINTLMGCASTDYLTLVPALFIGTLKNILPVKAIRMPPELKLNYECYAHYGNSLAKESEILGEISQFINDIKTDIPVTGLNVPTI